MLVATTMDFSLSTKAKEAIKTGLAIMLVYSIALSLGWLSPSWASGTRPAMKSSGSPPGRVF
ncbi:MAG: hypothetical protein OES90_09235 [Xanthomonadales bacterium]|nr:hypothetical protein [Xanthomonadales bacterium]